MTINREQGSIFITDHALARFRDRFPDACGGRRDHEVRMLILSLWDSGLPWGATFDRARDGTRSSGHARITTIPATQERCVMFSAHEPGYLHPRLRTVLTYEQALANQQQKFRGGMAHHVAAPNRRLRLLRNKKAQNRWRGGSS